ncbi:response regulator [Stutzerimonas nosocomialis]|uniref:Response regulator n=1 Tax=Stutzerimonas nosocomialis TaxID=1056496 RepID=A0A5R9Q8U0_9GAMM|nr:response regulator [Stutzerimonas nosocomialis]TLX55717.1 response regulator [Stutzerimonas nosocomialis]TLX56008.1 response regulator [Stutzerimonas nosocomialis]TLX61521.1 response regulator [Stutzerimonas nosocomialis]
MTEFVGVRVLVVEDEGAIAMLIEDLLEELGCTVVASVARLGAACEAARSAEIDLAMLDVNLAGQLVFPVAEILRDRDIPFLFSTGYGASGIPSEFDGCQVLRKPFSDSDLRDKIALAVKPRR